MKRQSTDSTTTTATTTDTLTCKEEEAAAADETTHCVKRCRSTSPENPLVVCKKEQLATTTTITADVQQLHSLIVVYTDQEEGFNTLAIQCSNVPVLHRLRDVIYHSIEVNRHKSYPDVCVDVITVLTSLHETTVDSKELFLELKKVFHVTHDRSLMEDYLTKKKYESESIHVRYLNRTIHEANQEISDILKRDNIIDIVFAHGWC